MELCDRELRLYQRIAGLEAERSQWQATANDQDALLNMANEKIERLKARILENQYCWVHGNNSEGTTGGVYLRDECPDCSAAHLTESRNE
jgi:hypothetical protein